MSPATASLRAFAYDEDLPDLQAPRWCPWLYPSGLRLSAVATEIVAAVLRHEATLKVRKQPRRSRDLDVFKRTVGSLIAHVIYEILRGAGPVRVSLNKKDLARDSRYLSDLHSKQLPHIIRMLSSPEVGVLTFQPGQRETPFSAGRQSRIAAGPRLLSMIEGVSLDDIARAEGEELVLLRSDKDTEAEAGRVELKEYNDTEETNQYRVEVREINAWLASADIHYTGSESLVDPRKRYLQRRFTRGDATFGNGGRLYGGFWIPLNKASRLADIRIDGESVVEIDFSATYMQLAYAYSGKQSPEGDLYAIPFSDTLGAPAVLPRDVVKKAISARFNGANGWPDELKEYSKALPWRRFVECVKAAHSAIAAYIDRDCGQRLTFTESQILIGALLSLKGNGIVALPVHDCIVVPESAEAEGVAAMLEAFEYHTGFLGRLKVRRAPTPAPVVITPTQRLQLLAEAANF